MTKAAIVVLSGGQDSTTCLYLARDMFDVVHAVTFDYGQSHIIEIASARKIANMAGVASHEVVQLGSVLASSSPLVDRSAKLETYADFETMDRTIGDRVELTFVPMRNLLFLAIAANRAVCHGARAIVVGISAADNANYPDCREVFADAMERVCNTAIGAERSPKLSIVAPLLDTDKAETVRLAARLPGCMDALAWSHTCYAGVFPPCGCCHACVLRAHGFAKAGIHDPLLQRALA